MHASGGIRHVSLVAATLEHLDAEDHSVSRLCRLLQVDEPPSWPPEFIGPDTRNWFRQILLADPAAGEWGTHYVIVASGGNKMLAGSAGYKGRPSEAGMVEVGYSVVPELQRQGIATAAVLLLIDKAFADRAVKTIAVETLPGMTGSLGVIRACGFRLASERADPDVGTILRYEINRSEIAGH